MRNNLKTKTILIVAVVLVFVYGIFGIPQAFSGHGLRDALTQKIRLGLDLKGGTHLVLQVQVAEAVAAATAVDASRIEADLKTAQTPVASVTTPDPVNHPEVIQITGTPLDKSGDVRSTLQGRYATQYDISADANNVWTLKMKPSAVSDLEKHALEQSQETILTRINSLGLTEPVVAPYNLGSNQLLVELPGRAVDVQDRRGRAQAAAGGCGVHHHHQLFGQHPQQSFSRSRQARRGAHHL